MSKRLGFVCIEVVIDGESIYYLNDVLCVDDKLLFAYEQSLHNSAGELYQIRAVNCGLESLFAPVLYERNQCSQIPQLQIARWVCPRACCGVKRRVHIQYHSRQDWPLVEHMKLS